MMKTSSKVSYKVGGSSNSPGLSNNKVTVEGAKIYIKMNPNVANNNYSPKNMAASKSINSPKATGHFQINNLKTISPRSNHNIDNLMQESATVITAMGKVSQGSQIAKNTVSEDDEVIKDEPEA